jgi:hypothetical protein
MLCTFYILLVIQNKVLSPFIEKSHHLTSQAKGKYLSETVKFKYPKRQFEIHCRVSCGNIFYSSVISTIKRVPLEKRDVCVYAYVKWQGIQHVSTCTIWQWHFQSEFLYEFITCCDNIQDFEELGLESLRSKLCL